ncbi:YlbD family protein [Ornithinibacillus californiensis]|uniref:YlbD family protein n=1 Tax=Ornithinibacillus californiensis TaxID=161536 RepID=UPI00064DCC6B|nr:spore coat protein YlbD [Ornithinibacillus californiensis]
MTNEHLHPKVSEFREFINRHPKLRKEIRKTGRTWQELYEKWILLGEDDDFWEDYKEESLNEESKDDNKAELFAQLLKYAEKMDIDKVQKQVHQLSGTIGTIQELLDQYQGTKKGPRSNENSFNWFRD